MESKAGVAQAASGDLLTSLLRDVSRSFYLTLRVLPGSVRRQIGLAYLLARTSDTIADTQLVALKDRVQALERLKSGIQNGSGGTLSLGELSAHQGNPAERILLQRVDESLSLLDTLSSADRQDTIRVLEIIIAGQESDLVTFGTPEAGHVRALKEAADLDLYTYQVAGCVGEFWTRLCRRHVFPSAKLDETLFFDRAVRFGKGLQLINILRDLPADLTNGRCYLPASQLKGAGLEASDLLKPGPAVAAALAPVYTKWLNLCEDHLHAGWAYTNSIPVRHVRVRLACAWPLLIAFETLQLLRNAPVLGAARVKVPRSRVKKLLLRSVALYPFPNAWRKQVPARKSEKA